jgi:hypothetical protein
MPGLSRSEARRPGGTCPIPRAATSCPPLHPVHRTGALFFLPPAAPRILAFRIDDEALRARHLSTRAGWSRPPVATSPRTQKPHFRSSSTSCSCPFSMLRSHCLLPSAPSTPSLALPSGAARLRPKASARKLMTCKDSSSAMLHFCFWSYVLIPSLLFFVYKRASVDSLFTNYHILFYFNNWITLKLPTDGISHPTLPVRQARRRKRSPREAREEE